MEATLLLQNSGLPRQTSETNFLFSTVVPMNGSLIQFPHVALDPVYLPFGHDYGGGYDREMMGRPGYPEERPHGWYSGRSSGGYQGCPF
ncbi:hypothetical protein Gogos_007831 [Gossypium gossypioides]|uniref:Uncharacterized protein n=1 Tax=Gossypium gossypioides TaxID=34282 RepID=A0A7J9C9W0_GOSGO|nr:hypothetical protein [Gossypium gossypioides]